MQDLFIHTPLHVSNFWKTKKSFHEIWTSIGHDFPKKIKNKCIFKSKYISPLHFALKFQSKLQSCFAVCFEISKQTAKQTLKFQSKLQSKLGSFKANYKAHFVVSNLSL